MILLFLFCVVLFAWRCAMHDAEIIALGKEVLHGPSWRFRAIVSIGPIVAFAMAMDCLPHWSEMPEPWTWAFVKAVIKPLVPLALLCIAAGALFSACFRLFLNKRRGLHWAYISPSNWYDSMFLFIAGDGILSKGKKRQSISRDAGRLAYICELLLTLAALVAVSKL